MRKIALLLATALLLGAAALAAEQKFSDLQFLVVKESNGKPVRNASVVLHPVEKSGKAARGGIQLKTDQEGRATFNSTPYGKLRIQVLAPGYQTFGDDFDVNQPTQEITIKLKKPQEQYSIYK